MASRTKTPKAGGPRGQAAPRGKRAPAPKAARRDLLDAPQPASPVEGAPEATQILPQVAAALPHPDEATIIGSTVSTAALEAATQAAEGMVPAVEAPLPAELGEAPGTASGIVASGPAPADAQANISSAAIAGTDGGGSAQEREPRGRPRLVSSSDEMPAPPASARPSRGREAERTEWPGQGGAEGILGHAAARSAAIAALGLLDLNTRMLDLLKQQSEVSLSSMQAVLTAGSLADAVRAQTDGVSRVLNLQARHWQEITRAVGRVVEDAAEPVRVASLWQAP